MECSELLHAHSFHASLGFAIAPAYHRQRHLEVACCWECSKVVHCAA